MCAAAELDGHFNRRVSARIGGSNCYHSDWIRISLAEHRAHARELSCLNKRNHRCAHRRAGLNLLKHMPLDRDDLFGRQRLLVRKVEPQLLGVHERALLLHMFSEHTTKRPIQQVGGRVVLHGRDATRRNRQFCGITGLHRTFDKLSDMKNVIALLFGCDNFKTPARSRDGTGIPNLPPSLGVKVRAIEDQSHAGLAGHLTGFVRGAALDETQDFRDRRRPSVHLVILWRIIGRGEHR